MGIVMITTVQNSYCLSYQFTDPKIKPAWDGERHGWIKKWPDTVEDKDDESKLGLWTQYIVLRRKCQSDGDRHALEAVQFYFDNRDAMDAGAELLAENYKPITLEDGTETVHSALQEAFNKIADTNLEAFKTEYQNNPKPEEEVQRIQLTAAKVQSRLSGLSQGEVPSDRRFRTIGLDLGKYASHWTDMAWGEGCTGTVVDYGILETHGLNSQSDNQAIETALVESMEVWAEDILQHNPDIVLVDSGNWRDAAYEICRRLGKPFYPAKGWELGRFRMPKRSNEKQPFHECYASYQAEHAVWLYNVQTEYWKQWLQERFLTRTFDDAVNRTDGSIALFENGGDTKRHLSFAHHICAEEEQWQPKENKQLQRVWVVKNRNNHWLDSTALACAGAGTLGVRLVKETAPKASKIIRRKRATRPRLTNQYGQPFVARNR